MVNVHMEAQITQRVGAAGVNEVATKENNITRLKPNRVTTNSRSTTCQKTAAKESVRGGPDFKCCFRLERNDGKKGNRLIRCVEEGLIRNIVCVRGLDLATGKTL